MAGSKAQNPGQPATWDSDADGLPCERTYDADAIARVLDLSA